jgi:D-alanyl-D-alanine dipeptidase
MSQLPPGFVYLASVDPSIQQQLRYCSTENFIGTVIDGYLAPKAIMTLEAATALSKVQQELLTEGFSLVVYDSYRPQKAVDHFGRWSRDAADQAKRAEYYPSIDKKDVFDLGYVAARSGHSRGSTVDLTIIRLDAALTRPALERRRLADGTTIGVLADGTVDMGSGFDLFSDISHHCCATPADNTTDTTTDRPPPITAEQAANRQFLLRKMDAQGFQMLPSEWWHYSLRGEPFTDTYFDFDVC